MVKEHNKNEHKKESHKAEHHHKDETVNINKKEYEELLKAKEAQQKLLYAYAELENFNKRMCRDTEQKLAYANESIIRAMLPIMDNLCRAKEHATISESKEDQFNAFISGVDLILKQLNEVLSKFGVKALNSVGEKFDPQFHEAMDQVAVDNEGDCGKVMNEYQKGYKLHDRVIRPCRVCVATTKKKEE